MGGPASRWRLLEYLPYEADSLSVFSSSQNVAKLHEGPYVILSIEMVVGTPYMY